MADKAWVVWYEDAEGPGDPSVYLSQASAEVRIKDLIESVLSTVEEQIALDEDEVERLNDIKQLIAQGDIMGAHGEWKTLEEEIASDEMIHVMQAEIIP